VQSQFVATSKEHHSEDKSMMIDGRAPHVAMAHVVGDSQAM
jgi:hypothetical protein